VKKCTKTERRRMVGGGDGSSGDGMVVGGAVVVGVAMVGCAVVVVEVGGDGGDGV
jgi:hypothetical protein